MNFDKSAPKNSVREQGGESAITGNILPEQPEVIKMDISSGTEIPAIFGEPIVLEPQHPVKFMEVPSEGYSYYGRKAVSGVDLIAMRWEGSDRFKPASPVKISEKEETYRPVPIDRAAELGLASTDGVFLKMAPTTVFLVPQGFSVTIHSRESSTELIEGGKGIGIAVDTQGFVYKFDFDRNTTPQKGLPAAYRVRE